MLFLGDVAHPYESPVKWPLDFKDKPIVLNLEGPIISGRSSELLQKPVLFNHCSIIDTFSSYNVIAVCLANNHICDIDGGIDNTKDILTVHGIDSFGAGCVEASLKEVTYSENGCMHVIVAFGWEVIQCISASSDKQGVNPLKYKLVIAQLIALREKYPSAILTCCFHWNYELERYPQPAHRQLAIDLIDLGVDCIIGHHPHIIGGVEFYKGKPIVYSLGNWWLPQGVFSNGSIRYSKESYKQLAFEFSLDGNHKCHWFKYDIENHTIKFIKTTDPKSCDDVSDLTPFQGYNHTDYIEWFQSNRLKNKFLPIYKYYDSKFNYLYDLFVKIRHPLMIFLKKML